MFVSPCTLRSAQCAALIALAAAAGLARTVPEPADDHGSRPAESEVKTSCATAATHGSGRWLASALAPWFRAVSVWLTATQGAEVLVSSHPAAPNAGDNSSTISPATIRLPHLRSITATALVGADARANFSPRTHRWPHAVGPPAAPRSTLPPAAGTYVPGDSAANGTSVPLLQRITPVDAVTSPSRPARRVTPDRIPVGPAALPSRAARFVAKTAVFRRPGAPASRAATAGSLP